MPTAVQSTGGDADLERLLEAVGEALVGALTEGDPRRPFERLLERMMALTGSTRGFIGRIEQVAAEGRFLRTWARVGWDDRSAQPGQATASGHPSRMTDMLRALRGDDPQRPSRAEPDTPRFVAIPFQHGSELLGMAGLAGRPGGYPQEVARRLTLLGPLCAAILRARDATETRRPKLVAPEASRVPDEPGATRFAGMVAKSEIMLEVFQRIDDVARGDWTVLVEGETGAGKELVARAIHQLSPRRAKPFVAVNCAGLHESLLTSQLFGHRRGAFTGAVADQQGLFEAASGGTLFLDEIGHVPLSVQTALLRVLQEHEIIRLGESRPIKVDVRIVLATHRNLVAAVEAGEFRQDLLYRIRVARLRVPSLRRRREDIPLLVAHFVSESPAALQKGVRDVTPQAMERLLEYPWPGNVRELKSAVEYATIHCRRSTIGVEDLPPEVLGRDPSVTHELPFRRPDDPREEVLSALRQAKGNRSAAARLLGISRATFYRRLTELGIALEE